MHVVCLRQCLTGTWKSRVMVLVLVLRSSDLLRPMLILILHVSMQWSTESIEKVICFNKNARFIWCVVSRHCHELARKFHARNLHEKLVQVSWLCVTTITLERQDEIAGRILSVPSQHVIRPACIMDEYAVIFYRCLSHTMILPIMSFSEEIRHITCIYLCFILGRIIYVIINSGASFCQVERIKRFIHLAIYIASGYQ